MSDEDTSERAAESAGDKPPAGTHSGVARALRVVELVARNSPESSGVSALARELGLSKTVVHRILQELVAASFLAYNATSRQYRLGATSLAVGMAALRALDVPRVARPFLEELVRDTGETATLSVRQGWTRVYLDQVPSPQEIRMTVSLGTTHALHAGSSSKAILAAMHDEEITEYLAHHDLPALTAATITSRDGLWRELARIRDQGYAVSLSERQPGASSVAAPVSTAGIRPWGSVSVCGSRDSFTPKARERYALMVKETAKGISNACGFDSSDTAQVTA